MAAKKSKPVTKPITGKLVLTRIFDAPIDLMFCAWTDPKHMAKWWGPSAFTTPVCELDVRPGGALRIVMRGHDGTEYAMTGAFVDIKPQKRLSWNFTAMDADGTPALKGFTGITFAKQDKKTKVTVRTRVTGLIPAAKFMLQGMRMGWSQSLVRLKEFVTSVK